MEVLTWTSSPNRQNTANRFGGQYGFNSEVRQEDMTWQSGQLIGVLAVAQSDENSRAAARGLGWTAVEMKLVIVAQLDGAIGIPQHTRLGNCGSVSFDQALGELGRSSRLMKIFGGDWKRIAGGYGRELWASER